MKRSERKNIKTEPYQGHADPNHNSTDNHERYISGSVDIRGGIETKRPPHLQEEHDTERKQDNAHHKKVFVVNFLTLFAVVIYAGLTWWQGCSTKRAADTASKNLDAFKAVEAAQVTIEFTPTVTLGKPGQGVIVNGKVDVTNSGPTAATELRVRAWGWERNLEPPKPGIPSLVNSTMSITPLDVSGVLLGTNKAQHYPVGFQIGQVDEIRRGTWQAGIFAEYSYRDVFGNPPYSSRDCFMLDTNISAFIRCPENQFRR